MKNSSYSWSIEK